MVRVLDVDEHAFALLLGKSADYGIRELGLAAIADADLVKVGPKGYVHGWVFVGAPGVNALVHHPKYGHGKVTHIDEHGHAHVDFGGGKVHRFEHVAGHGEGHLLPRAKGNDHITAAGAASRAGRHAEAAEHYRQAAAEAKHPQIASEMRQRAAASAAKLPDRPGPTPAAGVPGSPERDTLMLHRRHMQSDAGRAAIDEAVRMHDADPGSSISPRTRSQIAAHLRASGDKLRRKRAGDQELQAAEGNRLHGLANLIGREPGSAEPGLRGGPRTEAHQARRAAEAAGEVPAPKPRTPRKPKVEPVATAPSTDHVQAIREAYGHARTRPGAWVPLADIREATPHLTREQQDEALRTLNRTPGHHVIPWDNTKALRQRDHDAALRIGGQDAHVMRIDPPNALGLDPSAHVDPFTPIPHAAEVSAARDAATAAAGRAKTTRQHTADAMLERLRGNHDAANRHLEAAAAVAPDEETRQRLLDARRGGSFDTPTPASSSTTDPANLAAELRAMPSRQAARDRLSTMSGTDLRALADHLQVGARGRNKKELAEILADETVGSRLTSSAFEHGTHLSAGRPKGDASQVARQAASPVRTTSGAIRAAPSGDEVTSRLRQATSRDEAHQYLDGLKLSAKDYKQLAKELNLPAGGNKTEIRRMLVEVFTGGRLDADSIMRSASRPRT